MIKRKMSDKIMSLLSKFPVLTITGPRQSGKSTLLKSILSNYKYLSFENPQLRLQASEDPQGFLDLHGSHLILDEIQYVPELFSYIQMIVDDKNEAGMFVLSGSQNFLLLESITQSLAGRVALFSLLPFSFGENQEIYKEFSVEKWLFYGGYPRIFDKEIDPIDYYPNYIQTYIERDVRQIKNIANLNEFVNFMKVCAARAGSVIDITDIANVCSISTKTVRSWLSILESSYIVFRLPPYYKNFDKRVTKSSKLYFYDTGLLCSLLAIQNENQLSFHSMRGHIFENAIIVEYMKSYFNAGKKPNLYFYRESQSHEIDLVWETNETLFAGEIKISKTAQKTYSKELIRFSIITETPLNNLQVIYIGEDALYNKVSYKNYQDVILALDK